MAAELKQTKEGLMEAFEHHLAYEIQMLRFTNFLLSVPAFSKGVANALIEAFCIHARNLIDFFNQQSETPGGSDYMGARHFCRKEYKSFPNGDLDTKLTGKLSQQIAHLTYNRSAKGEDKIGPDERKELMKAIEGEIELFANHLRSPYKAAWKLDLSTPNKLNPDATYGTTNHITTTQWTTAPIGPSQWFVYNSEPVGPTLAGANQ
jgi:hypothetical protein